MCSSLKEDAIQKYRDKQEQSPCSWLWSMTGKSDGEGKLYWADKTAVDESVNLRVVGTSRDLHTLKDVLVGRSYNGFYVHCKAGDKRKQCKT